MRITKGMFPIGDIFLFHLIYKVCFVSVILSVMIKVKGNVIIIEHIYKIGIETIFTITVQIISDCTTKEF